MLGAGFSYLSRVIRLESRLDTVMITGRDSYRADKQAIQMSRLWIVKVYA